ncbi:MAG TPA: ABC transporter permease [Thermoanaerobaculia bacterium]|jgi:putative ABC transport system permease protein
MNIAHDVRFALRTLRRRPAASVIIVLTLGLGIGANAVFFAAFYGMVLRPLPFAAPESLVTVTASQPARGETWHPVSALDLRDAVEDAPVFAGAAAYTWRSFNLRSDEEPESVRGHQVSADLFPLLGVAPMLGRHFLPEEDAPAGPRVALISHDVWTRRFAAEPHVIGRPLRLDDEVHEIVGVMPPGFQFQNDSHVWTPLRLDPAAERRDRRQLEVIARLAPGVAPEQAQAAVTAAGKRLAALHPETNEGWSFHVRPLRDAWLPPVTRLASAAQLVLVAGVLLIVCANVTNVVLAQATARAQERALRAVLGASRRRLIRQSLVESTVLALGGGAVGTLLAAWGETWIRSISPVPIPYWLTFHLDGHALLYILAVASVSGIVIGLLPSLRSSGSELFETLRSGGRTEVPGSGWLRHGLVVAEYAVTLVVLVAGLLMVKSFANVRAADPGFAVDRVLTLRLQLSGRAYDEPAARTAFLDEALRRLGGLAETAAAGAANRLPISQHGQVTTALGVDGRSFPEGEEPRVTCQWISEGHLEALDVPLLAGRAFTAGEVREGGAVALVDAALAARLWPDEDPIGRRLRSFGEEGGPWLEVVGVAGDVEPGEMIAGLDLVPPYRIYVPLATPAVARGGVDGPPRVPTLVLRSRAEPAALAAAARRELRRIDPGVPIFEVQTMEETLDRFYFAQHIWGRMFSTLAALALVIAVVGAYGVTAYSVSRRTRELGIRLAMGATPRRLLLQVEGQGLALAAAGVALGMLAAVPLARAMQSLLHDMSAIDAGVFSTVAGVLLAVGVLASYGPARRAAGVDPVGALRAE